MRNWLCSAVFVATIATSVWSSPSVRANEAEGSFAKAAAIRQAVWEFEKTLMPLGDQERSMRVRKYFASLKDPETQIEAIGMMDSRYVYLVPKNVRGEILGSLLRSTDNRVRLRAVQAVGYNNLAGDHALVLLGLLHREDVESKETVLRAMRSIRAPGFVSAIRAHLTHSSPRVRHAAASSLWHLEPQAVELVKLLQDPDPTVRQGVVHLIPRSKEAGVLLRDPESSVRITAARAMGDSGDRSLAPKLEPLLKDESETVRATAAYALGRLKASQYLSQLHLLLHDVDVVVRREAVLALAELRSPMSMEPMRAALNDVDGQVRKYAARAIRLIEEPELNPDSLR